MSLCNSIIKELVAIQILEEEIKFKKEIQDKQLRRFIPKDVGSVSYDQERVEGGTTQSEESSILDFAQTIDDINKLESLIKVLRDNVDVKINCISTALSEKERRIFKARYVDGKTYLDIAYDMDLSESQVYRICKGKIEAKVKELEELSNMLISNVNA